MRCIEGEWERNIHTGEKPVRKEEEEAEIKQGSHIIEKW